MSVHRSRRRVEVHENHMPSPGHGQADKDKVNVVAWMHDWLRLLTRPQLIHFFGMVGEEKPVFCAQRRSMWCHLLQAKHARQATLPNCGEPCRKTG